PESNLGILLDETVPLRNDVDAPGDGAPEAFEMCAAFAGVDRVDVRVEFLIVLGRVLQRDLEFELALHVFFRDIDRVRMYDLDAFVEVLHELGKPAGITIGSDRGRKRDGIDRAFIGDDNREAGVQEREFTEPVGEGIIVERRRLEYRCIRDKVDPGAGELVPERREERCPVFLLVSGRIVGCSSEIELAGNGTWGRDGDSTSDITGCRGCQCRGPAKRCRLAVPLLVPGEELSEALLTSRER